LCAQKELWMNKRKSCKFVIKRIELIFIVTSRKSRLSYADTFGGISLPDEEHSYRIVLVGAGGVGKSAVAVRFLREKFVEKVT
jgi:hypothetical protein